MGATTSPLSVHVALQAYAVFLSALLVHNAFNVLNKAAEQYEDYEKWRVEEVTRVGNGSLFSAAHSVWPNYEYPSIRLEDGAPESTDYHKQPILMFMMHIGPALLWSLIAPLQLSAVRSLASMLFDCLNSWPRRKLARCRRGSIVRWARSSSCALQQSVSARS